MGAEDLTIPQLYRCESLCPGQELSGVSLLNIAPTVAGLFGLDPVEEWEGNDLRK